MFASKDAVTVWEGSKAPEHTKSIALSCAERIARERFTEMGLRGSPRVEVIQVCFE